MVKASLIFIFKPYLVWKYGVNGQHECTSDFRLTVNPLNPSSQYRSTVALHRAHITQREDPWSRCDTTTLAFVRTQFENNRISQIRSYSWTWNSTRLRLYIITVLVTHICHNLRFNLFVYFLDLLYGQ